MKPTTLLPLACSLLANISLNKMCRSIGFSLLRQVQK